MCGIFALIEETKVDPKNENDVLNNYKDIIFKYRDWDANAQYIKNRYTYYKCLCYQLVPETENSKHWGMGHPIYILASNVSKCFYKILKLDKKTEPGYSILYGFSQSIIFILTIIFIVIIIRKNKKI